MSTPGQAVLERVKRHRELASTMEAYAPDQARVMRELAGEYEAVVMSNMPEWWSLVAVQASKGWGQKWLRNRCKSLAEIGKAKKGENGRWIMRWDAVLETPDRPREQAEIDASRDLDELADELAREG